MPRRFSTVGSRVILEVARVHGCVCLLFVASALSFQNAVAGVKNRSELRDPKPLVDFRFRARAENMRLVCETLTVPQPPFMLLARPVYRLKVLRPVRLLRLGASRT